MGSRPWAERWLDIEQRELAERMGYDPRYVVNVLNGFTQPSHAFKDAFGAAVADLLLGQTRREARCYPAAPLVEMMRKGRRTHLTRPTSMPISGSPATAGAHADRFRRSSRSHLLRARRAPELDVSRKCAGSVTRAGPRGNTWR